MSDEEEKKEGQAVEEQGEGKDVQDQVPHVPAPLYGRRRFFEHGRDPDLRAVWLEPLGAREMAAMAPTSWNPDAIRNRVGLSGTPFDREYLGEFPAPVMEEVIAEGLWAQYHLACEKFDQVVCSGRRQGVAIPLRGDEYRMISSHAAGRRRYLVNKARSMGISRDQLAVSGRAVNRELMSSWNYLVEETMMALVRRMNDVLGSDHE